MQIIHLRTLHTENPLGIDTTPYFSWVLESVKPDTMQQTYRIEVKCGTQSVWDTGIVKSSKSTFVNYEGQPLSSCTVYKWTVTVTDNHGDTASASATFETAFLDKGSWNAKWAESALPRTKSKDGFGNQPPATMFRKSFQLKRNVKNARLYATCHGIYRLTVNGTRPDDRELAPENSSYAHLLHYQTYDVTRLLASGENAIGIYVGDGWYCGPKTIPNIKKFKPAHAVLFQLEVEYADGSQETVCSDETVKTSYGPVLFSDLFAGEKYDANKEIPGWDKPGFRDADWRPVKIADYGYDKLQAQAGAVVRPIMELPVKRIYTSSKGETILELEQNIAGRLRIHVNAPKGTEIQIDHFEATDTEGNYFNNIMSDVGGVGGGCDQRVIYVSNGKEALYEPIFSFHGFQYARITGWPGVKPEDITAVVLSTDKENLGTFECSDPRLNRLYENTRWSQRSNMISIPTDCPQREKTGWTGDIQIYAETAQLNEDVTPLLTRWMKSVAADQGENGAVPITVPYEKHYIQMAKNYGTIMHNKGLAASAGWGDAAVIVPWHLYQTTGNIEIFKQQYDSMKRWCDYIITTARTQRGSRKLPEEIDQYLWNTGFHFGDWLVPSLTKDGYNTLQLLKMINLTKQFTAPVYGWYSVSSFAKAAGLIGKEEDAKQYQRVADKMKHAISYGLVDENGNMPVDLMGAYVLPLYFDLVPEKHKKRFGEHLVKMIHDNGGCLDTGFLGTPFLLDALCKAGYEEEAYKLLYQEKCPSWLYEVKMGATTIWESWYSFKEDGTPLPMSLNHYAFGCVDSWMFRYIAGMDRLEPGFEKILIQPRPDESLTYAKRSYFCEYGLIETDWHKSGKQFCLNVTIPCNTTAVIVLPNGERYETGSGKYSYFCEV